MPLKTVFIGKPFSTRIPFDLEIHSLKISYSGRHLEKEL